VTDFIALVVSGLSLGFVYALIALGFVMIFKASRVVNFAHGSVLLLGAYAIARTHDDLGFAGAVLFGVVVAAVVAVLVQFLILRRLSHASVDTLTIVTIGVDILLATELTRRIGEKVFDIGDPWNDRVFSFGSISVPEARIAAAIVAALVLVAFGAVHRFTDWGIEPPRV